MNCPIRTWGRGALLGIGVALAPAGALGQDLAAPVDAGAEVSDLGEPVGIQPSTTPSAFACGMGRGAGARRGQPWGSSGGAASVGAGLALVAWALRRRRPAAGSER